MAGLSVTVAFVLGGAGCIWDDLDEARELATPDLIIATNHAGRDFKGHVDHWVSMHAELLAHWQGQRHRAGRSPAGKLWSAQHRQGGPATIDRIPSPGGSSGLLAVFVGLHLGIDRIICCGVPMSSNEAHYDDRKRWMEARMYLPAWRRALPKMQDRVRSMSGETAILLGRPDGTWLNGEDSGETAA